MDDKTQNKSKKKHPILISLPADYADRLSKIANKEHRSTTAQAEFIVMRTLDNQPTARGAA